MIGHFVNNLRHESEDNILMARLAPGFYCAPNETRCVMGAAGGFEMDSDWESQARARGFFFRYSRGSESDDRYCMVIERQYDSLCRRFGAPRVNQAIRNRILSNRARRELHRPAEPVSLLIAAGSACTGDE